MPEYYNDGLPGRKPPEKELNQRLHEENQAKNKAEAEKAKPQPEKQLSPEKLKDDRPAERMYGQDRVGQHQENAKGQQQKSETLTPAQQEMREKREAARAQAQQERDKARSDKEQGRTAPKPPEQSRDR